MKIGTTQLIGVAHGTEDDARTRALAASETEAVHVPTATPGEAGAVGQALARYLADDSLQAALARANFTVNISFDADHLKAHPELLSAFGVLSSAALAPSPRPATPPVAPLYPASLTLQQGVLGGATVGAVAGLGIMEVLHGLKSMTDSFSNPVVSTVGAVLLGIAAGATTGAIVAKTSEYNVGVTAHGVNFSAGTKPATADA